MDKSPDAFRTISEVADWLGTPTHVLRFWESRFTQIKPVKRAGGRRYYRPGDMALLGGIKKLLHDDGLTIRGVQKILREQGVKYVSSLSQMVDGDEEVAEAGFAQDVPTEPPRAELVQMRPEAPVPKPTPETVPEAESLNPFARPAEPAMPDTAVPDEGADAQKDADGGIGADLETATSDDDTSTDRSAAPMENLFQPDPQREDESAWDMPRTQARAPEETGSPEPDTDEATEERDTDTAAVDDGPTGDAWDTPEADEPPVEEAATVFRPRATPDASAPAAPPEPVPAFARGAAAPVGSGAPDLADLPPLPEGPSVFDQVLTLLRKGAAPPPDRVQSAYDRLSDLRARMSSGRQG